MNEADLLIMVGASVADRSVTQPDLVTKGKVVVHIDVDPAEIGKNASSNIPLVGDARSIFDELLKIDYEADYSEWLKTLDEYKISMAIKRSPDPSYVDPAAFINMLSHSMDKDAIYIADVGQNQIWSCDNVCIREGKFMTTGGMGTMGYSIPAAIGAKLRRPERQVVAVCGDGAFQMSMCEFATARQHGVPMKVVVLTNNYLGMVREYQHYTYHDKYSVVDLSGNPDLEKLSSAYDMSYIKLTDMSGAQAAIDRFLADSNSCILEAIIDPMDLVK
jgi:acetolactate synthase-1/2/3 large subunit